MRVALIEAGSPGLNIYSHVAMGRGAPILATVLAQHGYETRAFIEDVSGKGSVDWDWVARADVIGFSTITCTLTRTAELVRTARAANPRGVIVFGGPESTCAPERSLDAGADYVIRGEAELSLPQFVEAIRGAPEARSGALGAIPGIVWRDEGGVHTGPPPVQLTREQVNALPLIDSTIVHGHERQSTGLAWRSRGCPERCDFCEVHEIWPRYVLRDEATSVEELMRCQQVAGSGAFLIDDNCAANKPSLKRFLREVAERGYAQPLTVQLRADAVYERGGRLDRELLRLLKAAAPVTTLCIGVESASDEDLTEIGKHQESRRVARALKAIRRRGLLVHGMMIAFADDTADTLRRNGAFARRYVTSLQYLFEVPLPGTKRTARNEAAGRILWNEIPELKFLDGMHVALRPSRVSLGEMQAIVVREYERFYSRARIAKAFLTGLFGRYRRLSDAQRRSYADLRGWQRLRAWAWLHLQFKFAPWAMLRIGRKRVLEFLRDADYLRYMSQLE